MAKSKVHTKDIDSLQEAFDKLGDDAGVIKDQIRKAEAIRHTTGIYADSEWYRLARLAMRIKRSQQTKLGRVLADLKRAERQKKGFNVARCFVDEARKVLPEDTFDDIMDSATAKVAMADAYELDSSG